MIISTQTEILESDTGTVVSTDLFISQIVRFCTMEYVIKTDQNPNQEVPYLVPNQRQQQQQQQRQQQQQQQQHLYKL